MIAILRFIGVINAAIWFGAAVFFTAGVAPAVFSQEMKSLLQFPYYPGAVAQILFSRFFILHYCCALVAIVHFLAEWLYTGRVFERFTFSLLIGILGLSLVGGLWLEPKLKELHKIRYVYPNTTPEQKEAARKTFGALHGSSQLANLFVAAGLLYYLWRVTTPNRVVHHSFNLP